MFIKGLPAFWKYMAPDYNGTISCLTGMLQPKSCNIINIWEELFIATWFRFINALYVREKVHTL